MQINLYKYTCDVINFFKKIIQSTIFPGKTNENQLVFIFNKFNI